MLVRPFRVATRKRETPDVVTLGLEPAHGDLLAPAPGQFNMLYAFGIGEVPISVSGTEGELILHTIRDVGAVTRALCAARPGDPVGLRGPFGTDWGLDTAVGGDIVVIGGGIGVAPLRPAIRDLVEGRDRYGRVSVLAGARSPEMFLFPDELTALAETPGIHVAMTVDQAEPSWRGRVGVVPDLVPEAPFDPASAVALVCGPEVMIRFTAAALLARGMPPERIRVSMERNMDCGVGHCGHCQLGPVFVCLDGPVFPWAEVAQMTAIREL